MPKLFYVHSLPRRHEEHEDFALVFLRELSELSVFVVCNIFANKRCRFFLVSNKQSCYILGI